MTGSILKELSIRWGSGAARDKLISELEDYAGYADVQIIVVFDAYHTDRMQLTQEGKNSVEVVFTRKKETADHYIERLVSTLDTRQYDVKVATSDGVEQVVVMGRGASRLSARELEIDIMQAKRERNRQMDRIQPIKPHTLENLLDPKILKKLRESLKEGE